MTKNDYKNNKNNNWHKIIGQQIFTLGKIIYAWKTLLIDQPIGESLYSPHRLLKNLLLIDKI